MPTHAEKRVLPYSKEQLFNLVAQVDKYPEFLPWCLGCRVKSRTDEEVVADMIIGFKVFREGFTSRVHLNKPDRVDVKYENGPFKYLDNHFGINEITAYGSISYKELSQSIEDKQMKNGEYKALEKVVDQVTDRLDTTIDRLRSVLEA